MSWEAWGRGAEDPFCIDNLYKHGWESDPECEKWWKAGEPEKIYTINEAIMAYGDWRYSDDD